MRENPSFFLGKKNPVETVIWLDAISFCNEVQKRCGFSIRLPTEEEWEYCCRGGTAAAFYTGNAEKDLEICAWFLGNSNNTTHPVGEKVSNRFGLFDMHGNVWECCSSEFIVNGDLEASTDQRVLRGGSWNSLSRYCRSAVRHGYHFRDDYNNYVGFRVAN